MLASAFTPLILYTVVSATDGVTDVIASATGGQTDVFFGSFSEALNKGADIGGGPIMLIVVSLVSILAAGVLWLELVIRAALLYVGALLGVVVYAGLVDKNMWGHVRRWAGIMIAVILVKPVIVIVLGLAGALSADGRARTRSPPSSPASPSSCSRSSPAAMIYRFVPGFGDEIAGARNNRTAGRRRRPGRRRHQLPRRPRLPGHQDPQQPAAATTAAAEAAAAAARQARQPRLRRRGRAQLPSSAGSGRRRICPLRRTPAPHASARSRTTQHAAHGARSTGNNSTGGGGR